MSAYVQHYRPPMGDSAFTYHYNGNVGYQSSPCQMYPRTTAPAASPLPHHGLPLQSLSNQVVGGSFFENNIAAVATSLDSSTAAHGQQQDHTRGQQQSRFPAALPGLSTAEPQPQRKRQRQPRKSMVLTSSDENKVFRQPRGKKSLDVTEHSIHQDVLSLESPKPKKRTRTSKKQPQEPAETISEEEDGDGEGGLPKDPRRRRILERNRIAATKCRLRKRDEADALASREQAMEDHHRYLSTCFESLTAEIYQLKTQLLQHTDCDCSLIQKYITNEAKKSVEGLMSCSTAFHAYGDCASPGRIDSTRASSIADTLTILSPISDNMTPTWNNSFSSESKTSRVAEGMFDMGLDPYQKTSLLPSPVLLTPPILNGSDPSVCTPDLYPDMVSQGEVVWDVVNWDLP